MWDLGHKESWAPKNWCFWTVVLEKTLEGPLDCKEIQPVHPKGNQSWIFIGRTDVEAETPILWPADAKLIHMKRPWCCERLKMGGEGEDRGWDGWMASLTQWTWVWVNSRSWWWTWRPGVLQFMRSQRVGHDWAIELNWTAPHQAPLSMGFFRQKYWSGLQFPPPRDLLNPEIKPPGRFFTWGATRETCFLYVGIVTLYILWLFVNWLQARLNWASWGHRLYWAILIGSFQSSILLQLLWNLDHYT